MRSTAIAPMFCPDAGPASESAAMVVAVGMAVVMAAEAKEELAMAAEAREGVEKAAAAAATVAATAAVAGPSPV